MASLMSAIQAQLATDIETTSITKCYQGSAARSVITPRAELFIGGGDIDDFLTQVQDRVTGFVVTVTGSSQEIVELALEELIELWRTSTGYGARLAALQALKVITIYPVVVYPAMIYSGSTTTKPFKGAIEFAMIVRYT